MYKTILITGSTDGIGLEAAKMMHKGGHRVLLHGRSKEKLAKAKEALGGEDVECYVADLSRISDVESLAKEVTEKHAELDVLINNAGVLKVPGSKVTAEGLDVRFAVNTIAPYLLTQRLLPLIPASGRVINVSSAAQNPVNLEALIKNTQVSSDMSAYGQSKLAMMMWSRQMAQELKNGPAVITVNPGSLLATKMVKDGFGIDGSDVGKGAEILTRLAVAEEMTPASGKYFDNDSGQFASPHPDASNPKRCQQVVYAIKDVLGMK